MEFAAFAEAALDPVTVGERGGETGGDFGRGAKDVLQVVLPRARILAMQPTDVSMCPS